MEDNDKSLKDVDRIETKSFINFRVLMIAVFFVIISIALSIALGLVVTKNKNKDKDKETIDLNNLSIKTPISYKQPTESTPAKHVLVHLPDMEIFMSTLNPAASLYENVTDGVKVKECLENLYKILKEKNIDLITIRSALKINMEEVRQLAFESLSYEVDNSSNTTGEYYDRFEYYSSDEFKQKVINLLSDDQLINVVLTNPTYKVKYSEINTHIEPTLISFNPVGNLIFCRDQQITTAKGVVIGHTKAVQREAEHKIMRLVFKNLGEDIIIGDVGTSGDENAYLEGGDFFVAKKDLSMCGVGLRTTLEGVYYLMKKDLLGTRYFAVIYDEYDLDQQRMHLDTYFNILNDKNVILLDFDEVASLTNKTVQRTVYLFDNDANAVKGDIDTAKIENEVGAYKLVKKYNKFEDFLTENGYNIYKVTNAQQEQYLINFLNIGDNTVLSVNKELEDIAKKAGVKTIYLEFKPILNMYGAMHCISQVSRVE